LEEEAKPVPCAAFPRGVHLLGVLLDRDGGEAQAGPPSLNAELEDVLEKREYGGPLGGAMKKATTARSNTTAET
jgi:hypothetical protein